MTAPEIALNGLEQQVAALAEKNKLLESRVHRLEKEFAFQDGRLEAWRDAIKENRKRSRLNLEWAAHQAAANKRLRTDAEASADELRERLRIEEALMAKFDEELKEEEKAPWQHERLEDPVGAQDSQPTLDGVESQVLDVPESQDDRKQFQYETARM